MISVSEWQQGAVTVASGVTVASIVAGARAAHRWAAGLGRRLDELEHHLAQRVDRIETRVGRIDDRLTHVEHTVYDARR